MHVLWNCAKKSTLILQFPNLTAYEGGVHPPSYFTIRVSEAASFFNVKLQYLLRNLLMNISDKQLVFNFQKYKKC